MNDEELYELYSEFYTEEGIPFPGSSKEDFLEWVKNQERYVITKGKREVWFVRTSKGWYWKR